MSLPSNRSKILWSLHVAPLRETTVSVSAGTMLVCAVFPFDPNCSPLDRCVISSTQPSSKLNCSTAHWLSLRSYMHVPANITCTQLDSNRGFSSASHSYAQHGLRRLCDHGQQRGCHRLGGVARASL